MLSPQIGITAGRLWETIGKQKRLTMAKLPTALKVQKDLALVALGWLAREGKVNLAETGKSTTLTLTESEQAIYDRNQAQPTTRAAEKAKVAEAGA